jgi:DNA-binding transcriptional MerR regulator
MRQLLSYNDGVSDEPRYAVGDLAELGGVSRRTVRYYVQEGLLPAPFGLGRGNHYGPEHLAQLLRVKALQESGRTLDEVRRLLAGTESRLEEPVRSVARQVSPELWRRVTVAPGVELHVSGDVRLPARKLIELAAWCRANLDPGNHNQQPGNEKDEDSNA